MSGRSAYVRKKITQTKQKNTSTTTSRSRPTTSSLDPDDSLLSDFPVPQNPVGTGVGTLNARFLRFGEPLQQQQQQQVNPTICHPSQMSHAQYNHGPQQYGGPMQMHMTMPPHVQQMQTMSGPMHGNMAQQTNSTPSVHSSEENRHTDEYGYARARRPTVKMDEVSGIEKSGLRSILDKKSEDVRRGLAKTFAFRGKHAAITSLADGKSGTMSPEFRSESMATVRHMYGPGPGTGVPMNPASLPSANSIGSGMGGSGISFVDQLPYSPDCITTHGRMPAPPNSSCNNLSPGQRWENAPMSAPPMGKLPPVPAPSSSSSSSSSGPSIKRWVGFGRPVQRWNKLRKDPELWDRSGDVLVYFGTRVTFPKPPPSFRVSSHVIEATNSRELLTILRQGWIQEDHMSRLGDASPMLRVKSATSPNSMGVHGQPTPPASETASIAGNADVRIAYELFFAPPSEAHKTEQLRFFITTRNVFAMLYHKSLVGLSLFQALSDLQARLELYMHLDTDVVGTMVDYLQTRGIDDVRNDAETAVSLLAWAEAPTVRWENGWKECFIHCAGLAISAGAFPLEDTSDYKHMSQISRALLDRAALETQVRVQQAEERLAEFFFPDLWPVNGGGAGAPDAVAVAAAASALERCRRFLLEHYSGVYGCWPPAAGMRRTSNTSMTMVRAPGQGSSDELWLTRTIAQDLQRDFGALYDYLVNRDIVWHDSEARASRKWLLVSSAGNKNFDADDAGIPMTDILVDFDNKQHYPHVPHPYPLIPSSIQPPVAVPLPTKDTCGNSMFKLSRHRTPTAPPSAPLPSIPHSANFERRIRLAYTESTNAHLLGADFAQSDLVDAFVKFEHADQLTTVDPALARRGRWILLYAILQTLATVAVDSPVVKRLDDVPYHLAPRLKGAKLPPWGDAKDRGPVEPAHTDSFCWAVTRMWSPGTSGGESEGEEDFDGMDPFSRRPNNPPSNLLSVKGETSYAMGLHNHGFITPVNRSIRSTVSSLPFGASASMSVLDDSGGAPIPPPRRTMWRDTGSVGEGYAWSSISSASVGGPQKLWPPPPPPPPPMTLPGYLGARMGMDRHLEEDGNSQTGSFNTAISAKGTVILDFDALDVIDGHGL